MAVIDATVAERSDRPPPSRWWAPHLLVGAALLLSAAAHMALLGSLLFAHPRTTDAPPAKTITVDLVPAKDIEPDTPKPELPKLEMPKPEPPKPGLEKSALPPAPAPALPPAAMPPQAAPMQPSTAAAAQQPEPPGAATIPEEAGAAAVRLAQLFHLSELNPETAFEAPPSSDRARLSDKDITAFKEHLKTCWKPPADVPPAASLKAAIRIALSRDGRLSHEPVLLAASASIHGPALVKRALAALTQCQPYAMLPASKYQEWKQLDLRFTSHDILDVRSGAGFASKSAKR